MLQCQRLSGKRSPNPSTRGVEYEVLMVDIVRGHRVHERELARATQVSYWFAALIGGFDAIYVAGNEEIGWGRSEA